MSREVRVIDCPYKSLRLHYKDTKYSLPITCMICSTGLERHIPIRVWRYIFSFLETHYLREHELFVEESKKYELMINPQKDSCILNFAYHNSYANFILDALNKFHAINYGYAVSKLPLFNVEKPLVPYPPKMESVYRRQSIESVLSNLLDIFPEGVYEKSNSSIRAKKIDCSGCKEKILTQSTPYKEKVAVMNTLISVFNTIEYLKNHIPYVKERFTFIYINGIHTPIPLPLTFEIYLGLAQHV